MGRTLLALAVLTAALVVGAPSNASTDVSDHDVYASIGATSIVLGNSVVERTWSPDHLVTTSLVDKRTGFAVSSPAADFSIDLDGAAISSGVLDITNASTEVLPEGGVKIVFTLDLPAIRVIRSVFAYPGIAGFRSTTTLAPLSTLTLSGYSLERFAAGTAGTPTIHSFRAGADWRFDSGWSPAGIGDPHKGDWRLTSTAPAGTAIEKPGQWLSMSYPQGERAFMVLERRDYASSVMSYDGNVASAKVDFSRDIIYFGPIEQNAHAENPNPTPARHRALIPGEGLELESVFLGLGKDADDEPWQHYRYLAEHRMKPYPKAVTFNTNNVDSNRISSGAKDDVDFATFRDSLLPAARELGVETFIFDDGWQARSGDWCPDSPQCQEPRWDGTDTSKYKPRFPDSTFTAVTDLLKGDSSTTADDINLGLWMTPMEFHPSSSAFSKSPEWSCHPVGDGTSLLSIAQPDSSSNEAGLGVWNPLAIGTHPDSMQPMRFIDYQESRITRAIEVYGARYFKFDFLVWIDCGGVAPSDMYSYHDAFVAMIDRLQAAHPEVTIQIDETNDYRMFPFESVVRGPSWFQNGSPTTTQLLHNLWVLAPYVPGFSLGQHVLGNSNDKAARGVDYLMSVSLGSHITFWTDISKLASAERAKAKKWTDFYKANRDDIATFTYPLLSDPSLGKWTALQPWNALTGNGFLLAYRQNATNQTQVVGLKGISDGSYSLTEIDPATGISQPSATFDSATLRSGMSLTIPSTYGYKIIRIAKVG